MADNKDKNTDTEIEFTLEDEVETELSPVEIFSDKGGLKGGLDKETGLPMLTFATCSQKGFGVQTFALEYTQRLVERLQFYAENGVPEFVESADMDPIQCLDSSIMIKDGVVSFKLNGARGQKSTLCGTQEQFVEFVSSFAKRTPKLAKQIEKHLAKQKK